MSCKILSGKEPAAAIKGRIRANLNSKVHEYKLAVIMVGNNPASQAYVKGKQRDCEECGIGFELFHFNESVTQAEIENTIEKLNDQSNILGILIQLPLPEHLNKDVLINKINPEKDVDCFCEVNLGKLFLNHPMFEPCTPGGILDLCQYYNISLQGTNCVIIGRSDIVGKPLATMLINKGATVTVCNSHTKNLKDFTSAADIVICAVGKPRFITSNMIKKNAIVIDVGINRDETGKLCGDVDFDDVKVVAGAITPVPGGIGLMTRASLMQNLEKALGR